jgi:hypothetical protein
MAAIWGVDTPAIGACMIGSSIPSLWRNESKGFSFGRGDIILLSIARHHERVLDGSLSLRERARPKISIAETVVRDISAKKLEILRRFAVFDGC